MSVEEKLVVQHKKYELVPPDGGYGYFIFVAAIINFVSFHSNTKKT